MTMPQEERDRMKSQADMFAQMGMPFQRAENGMPLTAFHVWLKEQCDAGAFPADEIYIHRQGLHVWGCIDGEITDLKDCQCWEER